MQIELSLIPTTPGVYLFKGKQGHIIYVGKAKHLRKRISSYFRGQNQHSPKTTAMLAVANSLDTLSTNTEKEAFLLEASLIKKHRPRYNVVLKDDKQYLLFHIDKTHPYPRISIVRPRFSEQKGMKDVTFSYTEAGQSGIKAVEGSRNKGTFYGPYTSALAARETWKVIYRIFPLRRCSNRSFKNRVRPCLYYHMGQCLGPCTMLVSQEEYGDILQRVEMFLSGRSQELVAQLSIEMQFASNNLNFELAAKLRDQIAAVKQTLEKQSVVMHGMGNMDVIALAEIRQETKNTSEDQNKNEGVEYLLGLGILFVRSGQVMGGKTFYWPGLSLAEGPEVLAAFMTQFYESSTLIPSRILLPWALPGPDLDSDNEDGHDTVIIQEMLSDRLGAPVVISIPRNELEKRLVSMAATNAREGAARAKGPDISEILAERLDLPAPVQRIEAVDVSHTAGKDTRVGMVVYENGQPMRDQFRAYTIKDENVKEGDDYAALAHWAERRIESGPPWPDLLLIDGGRGQLATVARVLEEKGADACFELASIAKARTEEGRADRRAGNVSDRIFLLGRTNPLNLKPGSPELLFLQMIRDSVHDQAIGKHRQARNKAALTGELVRLPGVGLKTAKLLWDNFNSLKEMAEASEGKLAALPGIGKVKAKSLWQELRKFK